MIVIFAENKSPRLEYTCRQMFECFLNAKYLVVNSTENIPSHSVFINYSTRSIPSHFHFFPSGFLSETGVRNFSPEVNFHDPIVKLFPSSTSSLGFDIFSAVFWYLSRYEEYLPHQTDAHGRFPAEESLAGKNGFLNLPLVDLWLKELVDEVNKLNPGAMKLPSPKIVNTIDVDNAFAYIGKSFTRQTGAFAKHLLKGEIKKVKERNSVLKGKNQDPYDTYDYIKKIATEFDVPTIFFHLSGKLALHDRNISVDGEIYRNLLRNLNQWSVTAIHPSYHSNENEEALREEINMLAESSKTSITCSRQHFLKVKFPDTFLKLIKNGIKEDYSIGFANAVGFRAGTGRKYYFYNLRSEQETDLLLQPLCVMDGTLRDYLKLGPEEAKNLIAQLQKNIIKCGSTYVAVWHNETLGEYNGWEGWRDVYEFQFSNFKDPL